MNNCYNKEIEGKFIRINEVLDTIFENSNDPTDIVTELLNQIEYFKRDLLTNYKDKINEKEILSKIEELEEKSLSKAYELCETLN